MKPDRAKPPASSLWRVPALWLVIGGPALVVLASFVTLGLAWHGADRPLREAPPASSADSMTAATQARNHVAAPNR